MKIRSLLLGLLVGGVFLWLAIRNVQLNDVLAAFEQARLWLAIPFIALLTAFYGLKAARWRNLIHDDFDASVRELTGPMMIGFAANNVLPFRAGEIVRVYVTGEKFAMPKAYVLGTIVIERFFDLIAVATLSCLGLITMYVAQVEVAGSNRVLAATAVLTGTAALALFAMSRIDVTRLLALLRFLPDRFRTAIETHVARFQSGLTPVTDDGKLLPVFANSLLQWLALTGCIHVALIALNIDVSFAVSAILLGLMILGISLPSSPGYVGTIELAFVFCLGLFGIQNDVALASAIFYHALTFIAVTVTGLIFYVRFRLRSDA